MKPCWQPTLPPSFIAIPHDRDLSTRSVQQMDVTKRLTLKAESDPNQPGTCKLPMYERKKFFVLIGILLPLFLCILNVWKLFWIGNTNNNKSNLSTIYIIVGVVGGALFLMIIVLSVLFAIKTRRERNTLQFPMSDGLLRLPRPLRLTPPPSKSNSLPTFETTSMASSSSAWT